MSKTKKIIAVVVLALAAGLSYTSAAKHLKQKYLEERVGAIAILDKAARSILDGKPELVRKYREEHNTVIQAVEKKEKAIWLWALLSSIAVSGILCLAFLLAAKGAKNKARN
ncbi:MAG: hypothetical protein HZA01_02380 [Nitrospinae bacterium]|nr:hypothetical protein [Nitrospinota bacterium]